MLPHISYVVKNTDRNDPKKPKEENRGRLESMESSANLNRLAATVIISLPRGPKHGHQ